MSYSSGVTVEQHVSVSIHLTSVIDTNRNFAPKTSFCERKSSRT